MRRSIDGIVRVFVIGMCVLTLCLFCSCKQKEEPTPTPAPAPSGDTGGAGSGSTEPAPVVAETPKPAEPAPTTPVAEEPKAAEPAPAAEPEAVAVPAGMAPIPLELPKPMFVGTPQDTKVENLRKPLGKPRPPFLAPEGVKNVALGKPVSSTDEEPIIGELDMITDGDKEAADGSYVELGPFVQHVTVDLEADYTIYAIVVWHYHKQARVYYDVICQVSQDKDFVTGVTTLFNNDMDNSAGQGIGQDQHYTETNEGELIDGKGVVGRYVRLYSNGNTSNDLNHYIEVEVYGKPVE